MRSIIALIQDVARKPQWRLLLDYVGAKNFAETRVCCLPHFSSPASRAYRLDDGQLADDCGRVEELLRKSIDAGRSVTVLVDGDPDTRTNPDLLNPMAEPSWETLLARLILAYPEVRWLFVRLREDSGDFKKSHGLPGFFGAEVDPLFDGAGLRDWVRGCAAKGTHTRSDATYLARRTQEAIALDEETPHAYLHAYTAYRFGFRATPIDSAALADEILGPGRHPRNPVLVFEDIYLNFTDGEAGMSWLAQRGEKGRGRSTRWPFLETADHRIFVTSGQRLPGDDLKWRGNTEYIQRQKAAGKHLELLFKPYAGIFRLWEGAKLGRLLTWPNNGLACRGVANGFVWPPGKGAFSNDEHGHSSPGVMLLIAESLIERAEKLLEDGVHSVPQAVRGAVLANDALELLGGRTPTVAIEALRLKHQFEVLAECQFSGVEFNIQLKERLEEVRRDAAAISEWFGPKQREVAALNAEMQILMALVRVFRDYAQFDEEQVCMQRVRALHRRLDFLQKKSPLAALVLLLRWYIDSLLGSVGHFVAAMGIWIVVLTMLFMVTSGLDWKDGLEATFSSFIGIQPPGGPHNRAVTFVAMISGATHLGILISHLYSIISRK